MKKLLFIGLALLLCGVAFADGGEDFTVQQVSQCTDFVGSVESITDSNTAVGLFTAPYTTKALYLENVGANEAWVDLDDDTATAGTSDEIRLDPGSFRSFSGHKTSNIGIIASSSETTTVLVEACR